MHASLASYIYSFLTLTRNRMLYSALNFAAGFFGIPYEKQYLQSIQIEERGVCPCLFFSALTELTILSTNSSIVH